MTKGTRQKPGFPVNSNVLFCFFCFLNPLKILLKFLLDERPNRREKAMVIFKKVWTLTLDLKKKKQPVKNKMEFFCLHLNTLIFNFSI